LDIIARVRDTTTLPVAAYQVSGEYLMLKSAAAGGWLDERAIVMEALTGIKRAGADLVLTYFAKQAATWLRQA
jgi:porphobilinogen synthase